MDPERWRQVEQLYLAALEKKPDERAAFLTQASGADTALRDEVASLLSFAPDADNVLQAAVQEVASQASGVSATISGKFEATSGVTPKLGRYQLIEKIGKGGMGVVYRAMDPAIGRVVAIKTILTDEAGGEDSQLRARLLRESQAAGRLSHPNIVAIHDICEEGPTFLHRDGVCAGPHARSGDARGFHAAVERRGFAHLRGMRGGARLRS